MLKEQEQKQYQLLIKNNNMLNFKILMGEFKGKYVHIKLPVEFTDDTKEEVELEFDYPDGVDKESFNKVVGECFFDIYGKSKKKSAVESLKKIQEEIESVKKEAFEKAKIKAKNMSKKS